MKDKKTMSRLSYILSFAAPYRLQIVIYFILMALSTVFSVVSIGMAVPFLNLIFETGDNPAQVQQSFLEQAFRFIEQIKMQDGKETALIWVCSMLVVLFFLKNLTRYLGMNVLTPIRTGVLYDLRKSVHTRLLRLPMSYFTDQRKGDILTRLSSDVQEIEWAIMNSITSIIRDPLMIVGTLLMMFFISYKLTLFIFIVLPVSGFFIGRIGRSLKRTSHIGQKSLDRLMSVTEETLSGIRILKAFNAEKQSEKLFEEANSEFRKQNNRMINKRELSSPVSEFMGSIVISIVMYAGGVMVLNATGNSEGLDAASFITYIAMFSQIITPAKAVTTTFYNIQKGIASAERIREILKVEPEPDVTGEQSIDLKEFKDSIEFHNVTFSYGSEPVLKNISVKLSKGKITALVGASGAGKSTFADLIPRFILPDSGKITLDTVDIQQVPLHNLRKLIAIVPQQSILFNDTILANITLGDPNPDLQKAEDAAAAANALDFIHQMEYGMYTMAGENGGRLSGGQKQRIAIARAIYADTPVLILDEATSSLDSESEKHVQDALQHLMKDKTAVVIAHRLSTIIHADEILVLSDGCISDRGTHEELINRSTVYKKLYDLYANN
jgi:subfamily B ATP-binding cassette protein MsbA